MHSHQLAFKTAHSWSNFRIAYAFHRMNSVVKAYDPDQPRAPAGTEEAGQWISADGESSDSIVVAGGFANSDLKMKVQDFIAKNCEGGINRIIPGQFLNNTIEELLKFKAEGVKDANRCFKLLNENRFRK